MRVGDLNLLVKLYVFNITNSLKRCYGFYQFYCKGLKN